MKKLGITGWIIVLLGMVFIYLSIDPFMNDREQFIRIVGGTFLGTAVIIILIMAILSRYLPDEENKQ